MNYPLFAGEQIAWSGEKTLSSDGQEYRIMQTLLALNKLHSQTHTSSDIYMRNKAQNPKGLKNSRNLLTH